MNFPKRELFSFRNVAALPSRDKRGNYSQVGHVFIKDKINENGKYMQYKSIDIRNTEEAV